MPRPPVTIEGMLHHNRVGSLYSGSSLKTFYKLYYVVIAIWTEGGSGDEDAQYTILTTDHFSSLKKQEISNVCVCQLSFSPTTFFDINLLPSLTIRWNGEAVVIHLI